MSCTTPRSSVCARLCGTGGLRFIGGRATVRMKSAKFPPIQRSLYQLEAQALSTRKRKERTSRLEAPSQQAIAAARFSQLNIYVGTKQANLPARRKKRLECTAGFKDRAADVKKHATVVKVPMVKICGVTNVDDAILAAQAGAKFVGMILWPKSKRSVSVDTAKDIAKAVRLHKAEPVGVFVDEDAATIERCCSAANIGIAQLHGEGARSSLTKLPSHLVTIYVLHVDEGGTVQTPVPEANLVDWILLDSLQGGSGHSFDWEKLKDLSLNGKCGWLLAGGLKPENVAAAISILKPDFVDVSSGVTMSDGLQKDPTRIFAFMSAVEGCTLT